MIKLTFKLLTGLLTVLFLLVVIYSYSKPRSPSTEQAYSDRLSQDDITPENYPHAFNLSMCVRASMHVDGFTKYDLPAKAFDHLGLGKYAPNGMHVKTMYNLYAAQKPHPIDGALLVWEIYGCDQWLYMLKIKK